MTTVRRHIGREVYSVIPGNRAICRCLPGYTGDPFQRCNADPCSENPCGVNADCESAGNRAVCKCRQGYEVRETDTTLQDEFD